MQVLRSPWLGLEVWQNNTANDMFTVGESIERKVRVSMTSAPFEIRWPKQDPSVAVEICAWTDDSIFSLQPGDNVENHPIFSQLRAMANTPFGTGVLGLRNDAYNHLIGTRIQTHSATQDKVFYSAVRYQGQTTPLQQRLQRDNIYLTVFMNKQVANVIDFDEYEYIVLEF